MRFPYLKVLLLATLCVVLISVDGQSQTKPKIILKMDDLEPTWGGEMKPEWQRFIDTVRSKQLTTSIGVIWEHVPAGDAHFVSELTSLNEDCSVELFHHGWDHDLEGQVGEYSGHSYEYQKAEFDSAVAAANALGITLHTFAAPFNQTDATFETVINEAEDMKVWMYSPGVVASFSGLSLPRPYPYLSELSVGELDFAKFKNSYDNAVASNDSIFIIQGHPRNWDDEAYDQFELILDFLITQEQSSFVLPYEYYLSQVAVSANDFDSSGRLKVILKLDDIRAESAGNGVFRGSWQRYIDSINSFGVCSGIGAVMVDKLRYNDEWDNAITALHKSGNFEIWHHGWQHIRAEDRSWYEFQSTGYDYQLNQMQLGVDAGEELDIVLRTFGAPYNQTDDDTRLVLEQFPQMKVWLYSDDDTYQNMSVPRDNAHMETGGKLDSALFWTTYTDAKADGRDVLVLQGHAYLWDDDDFLLLESFVKAMQEDGQYFMLPYEYYLHTHEEELAYRAKFDFNGTSPLSGIAAQALKITETSDGRLILDEAYCQTLGAWSPLIVDNEGAIDVSSNPMVIVKARSNKRFPLRLDLVDDQNRSTKGANGKETRTLLGDGDWHYLVYDFTDEAFTDEISVGGVAGTVDPSAIDRIFLHLDPGNEGIPASLEIDYIAISEILPDAAKMDVAAFETSNEASLVYPNPMFDVLNTPVGEVTISNVLGEVVEQVQSNGEIQVSHLAPGIYIIAVGATTEVVYKVD